MQDSSDPSTVLSVSDLARELQAVLAGEIGSVRVRGEVSRMSVARSGHWYFSLNDDSAAIDCVMFRGSNRYARVQPNVGDAVVVSGELDLYAPRGQLTLVVRRVVADGDGDLAQRLEQLKRTLAAEGLLDPHRKRPLPRLPRAIGVVTSPTGAAFQDILRVLGERFPSIPVLLAPCRVQGQEAPLEIVAGLQRVAADGRAEVVIVGRGGGSAEDLAAFNDERVARAIAAMPIPVVSAVGHETDVSIADLVADVRAATPSHAAEMVVPDRSALFGAVEDLRIRLHVAIRRQISVARARVSAIRVLSPRMSLVRSRQQLAMVSDRLVLAGNRHIVDRRGRLTMAERQLHALSPYAVLGRGYALVRGATGSVVTEAGQVEAGETLSVQLQKGRIQVRVEVVEQ